MPAKQKGSGAIILTLTLSWIIIFVGIWRVFFREPSTDVNGTDTDTAATKYYVGEQVLLEGEINPSDDITQYSNTLTTSDGMVFGLKSSDITLDTYHGSVQLRGKIDEFKKQVPVIEVTDIVGLSDAGDGEMTGSTSSYRYFSAYKFGINLTIFPGYKVSEVGNQIQVVDTEGQIRLSVVPFTCISGDATQDCKILKARLQEQQAQRFTTADGVSFLKFTETKQWLAFNTDRYGYTVTAENDDDVQTHASVIQFLGEDTVGKYLEEARLVCKNINSKLGGISDYSVTITSEGRIEMTLEGTTSADTQGTCIVKSQAPEINIFTLITYDDGGAAPTEKKDDTPKDTTEKTTPSTTGTVGPVPPPTNLSSWVSYPSVRGWTLYISKDIVAYEGELLTGNEQPGCSYQINLYYRNKDADTAPVDGRIFECMPSGVSTLQNQGYTVVGITGDSTFLMKYMTNDIDGVKFYVE